MIRWSREQECYLDTLEIVDKFQRQRPLWQWTPEQRQRALEVMEYETEVVVQSRALLEPAVRECVQRHLSKPKFPQR
jgi:hypothetical protein